MKMKTLTGLLAASTIFASGAAMAEPFYIVAPDGTGDQKTQDIAQFGINWLAKSTYTTNGVDNNANGNPIDVGDAVVDSAPNGGTISSLLDEFANAIGIGNTNGNTDNAGYGSTWGLNFTYTDLKGVVVYEDAGIDDGNPATNDYYNVLAKYAGTLASPAGVIEVSYTDGATTKRVMNLGVINSTAVIGNIVLTAFVDFTGTDAIAQSMFYFMDGSNFYDIWNAGGASLLSISAEIDTNLDPTQNPVLVSTDPVTGQQIYTRESTLDGSVDLNRVPEPSVLALLGIGLVGMGIGRRVKKQRA